MEKRHMIPAFPEKDPRRRYVPPHAVVSREVFLEDLPSINTDREIMKALCGLTIGLLRGAHAIAHSQIEDKHPLRFFVTANAIVVNPRIVQHTNYGHLKQEGCMTFPDRDTVPMLRHHTNNTKFILTH